MASGKISAKQQEILEFIKEEILSKGYPPAVREICEAVHLKSTSSVHSHLETLERNGYIRRDPTKPRAIEILEDEFNLSRWIQSLIERYDGLLAKLKKKYPASCKFVNETNHIENDYIFQLDPFKFFQIPQFYLSEIETFLEEEKDTIINGFDKDIV